MDIMQFLASVLNPNPGQNRMVSPNLPGNYLTQTGLSPDQVARFHQMSGVAPQGSSPDAIAPQQAPQPDQQQTAAVAPAVAGGSMMDGLRNLFGGGGEQEAIQWLQQQGMDPGTATMFAKNKPALQQYLLQRSQGVEKQKPIEINGRLVDPNDYHVLADFSTPPSDNKPTSIQEYEYARDKQGFKGTLADWEASKKGNMSLQVDPTTGEVTFQQGGNIKPMTEGQSKDAYFATKAAGSIPNIDKYGDALTNPVESALANVPLVGNYAKSDEYQQAEQAGNEFLSAVLRKESGAAISIPERNEYGGMYLPRPGDGAPVLAQKKESRARAIEALKAGMTPQAILAQEKALRAGGTPPPAGTPSASGDDTPPASYTGKNWKWLTPEQRKLWQ